MTKATLCDQDFLQWTQQQAEYLRKGYWAGLDVEKLVDELETLGRSEQRELGSYLQVLLMHLLKCQDQPEKRTQSWNATLLSCRDKIQDCLEDTPSLQRLLQDSEWVAKYYRRACRDAAQEMQISAAVFLAECPYAIEQSLDPTFLNQSL